MKIELDNLARGQNRIDGYTDSSVVINGNEFRDSLIISSSEIITDWTIVSLNDLATQHIETMIGLKPEIIILGTGKSLVFPRPEIIAEIFRNKIGFEVMDNGAACRCYNLLLSENRKVVAGLIMEKNGVE